MKLIFVSEHWKFNVDSRNAKKMQQKIYGFLDNLIWIGNGKFSLITTRILVIGSQRVNRSSSHKLWGDWPYSIQPNWIILNFNYFPKTFLGKLKIMHS